MEGLDGTSSERGSMAVSTAGVKGVVLKKVNLILLNNSSQLIKWSFMLHGKAEKDKIGDCTALTNTCLLAQG